LKESLLSVLVESIRAVTAGQIWLDKRYANLGSARVDAEPDCGPKFNERQRSNALRSRGAVEQRDFRASADPRELREGHPQSLFQQTGVRTRGRWCASPSNSTPINSDAGVATGRCLPLTI
jgi:hypothetical protein